MKKLYQCTVTVDIDFYVVVDEGEKIELIVDDFADEAIDLYAHRQKDVDYNEIAITDNLLGLNENPYNYDGDFADLVQEYKEELSDLSITKIIPARGQGTLFD